MDARAHIDNTIIFSVIIPQIGFEPIQRDPKSLVLPLHYRGVNFSAIIIHDN